MRRTEEHGASGEEEGTQRLGAQWQDDSGQHRWLGGGLAVVQEGPTAEEKRGEEEG